jgi:hypothetical protein
MVSAPKDIGDYDPSARTLVIGVTGHRDLVPEEIPGIEAAVRELLEDLVDRFPRRKLQIMSPLAEGADRIAALVAEDLDIELIAPLPMPENIYAQDFESSRSWAEFSRLLDYATETTTLPLAPGSSEAAVSDYGPERNHQYAEVGAYIAARSDILIAIWDGKTIDDLGGTGWHRPHRQVSPRRQDAGLRSTCHRQTDTQFCVSHRLFAEQSERRAMPGSRAASDTLAGRPGRSP